MTQNIGLQLEWNLRTQNTIGMELKNSKKCYVHNIFITFSQQILSGRLLLVVMGG